MTTPRTVGAYRMLSKIGQGGMGEVWVGEHALLGRRAAVKLLKPAIAANADALTRFFNEARAAATISDPGIVQIFDFGHDESGAYIVMELLEGEPLDRRLARAGRLAIPDALRTVRQVASSLGAAHARNIIHRDLKPENIFLVRDAEVAGGERAKILDFGIAKLASDPMALKTQTAALIGTPMFMSPEQCRGSAVDARTDVYSLGCMLFVLVTGRPPFVGEGVGDVIAKHIIEEPPRASQLVPSVPPELDALILRCLAKSPVDRFADGSELAAAIDALLARAPHPIAATVAATARPFVAATLAATVPPGLAVTVPPPARTPSGTTPPPFDAAPPAITTLSRSAISTTPATVRARPPRGMLIALGAGLVCVSMLVTWLALRSDGSNASATPAPPPAAEHVVTARAPVATPTPAPAPATTGDARPAGARAQLADALAGFAPWAAAHRTARCPTARDLGAGESDPWGHALVVTCTDQPADQRIGVISLGPDGAAGTRDDLTSWSLGPDLTAAAHGPRWKPQASVKTTAPAAAASKRDRFHGTELGSDGIPTSR